MNANKGPTHWGQQTIAVGASPLFSLGHVVATLGALKLLEEHSMQAATLLDRHVHGDWRVMEDEDRKANIAAVQDGGRVFSSYFVDIHKIWIITEAVDDAGLRASTCILLPSEY